MASQDETERDSTRELLEQIRGLLILQLRSAKVDDTAIANVMRIKAKTVKNRYPLTKAEVEDTTPKPEDSAKSTTEVNPTKNATPTDSSR